MRTSRVGPPPSNTKGSLLSRTGGRHRPSASCEPVRRTHLAEWRRSPRRPPCAQRRRDGFAARCVVLARRTDAAVGGCGARRFAPTFHRPGTRASISRGVVRMPCPHEQISRRPVAVEHGRILNRDRQTSDGISIVRARGRANARGPTSTRTTPTFMRAAQIATLPGSVRSSRCSDRCGSRWLRRAEIAPMCHRPRWRASISRVASQLRVFTRTHVAEWRRAPRRPSCARRRSRCFRLGAWFPLSG